MSAVQLFATSSDLAKALLRLEKARKLRYFEAGVFDHSEPISFTSASNLPNLGKSQTGVFGSVPRYLLLENVVNPNVRAIRRNDSSDWWAIHQLLNPDSKC